MAEPTTPARWRCPACGTGLERSAASASGANGTAEIRLSCPDCGGQFRVRRREGGSGAPPAEVFSGEVPAVPLPPPAPPAIGGFGLAWRSLALRVLVPTYHAGNVVGGAASFALGGFVPVLRGWIREEFTGLSGALNAMGGIAVTTSAGDLDSDLGPILARGDAPELFSEVGEVARRLGARPPEQLRLAYLPCCGVVARGRSRALLVGLPLMQVLTRSELRAALAHEMAHLARGDATASARASRFVQALGAALDEAPKSSWSPLRGWARACRGLADGWHAPIAWGQEARADRAAASIAGGEAAAAALVKTAAVQPLFREVLDAYDPEDGGPNLYEFFRVFWSRLPESLFTAIRHKLLSDGETASDPAHPPLLDRIASVQSHPQRASTEADRAPAVLMLGDPEAFEQMLHNRLFAVGKVEPSVFHRARR